MRLVTEYWYTPKEKLPKETDLCVGIRENKYQFQISYKSGEWFDINGNKIAEPEIWHCLQMPKEIFGAPLITRYFNNEEEAKKLLDGKTYGEIIEILVPYCCDKYRMIYDANIDEWVPIPDDVVCCVDTVKHNFLHGTDHYAEVAFNFNGKKYCQQLKLSILPKNAKTIMVSSIE